MSSAVPRTGAGGVWWGGTGSGAACLGASVPPGQPLPSPSARSGKKEDPQRVPSGSRPRTSALRVAAAAPVCSPGLKVPTGAARVGQRWGRSGQEGRAVAAVTPPRHGPGTASPPMLGEIWRGVGRWRSGREGHGLFCSRGRSSVICLQSRR